MAAEPCDWQLGCTELKHRGSGAHLLQSGQWSDCSFLVGSEPHQVVVPGHKLILAMASPVFEAMFYGGMAERKELIPILDMQPEAFKALLEYIYTDNINISSFDKACELCYGAKKYMLPHLVKECTQYLFSNLHPKNACHAYEFARLFEEGLLMDECKQIISTNTKEVLTDSSFEEVELNTVITVFSLEHLNVDSELDLFEAAVRYAKAQDRRQHEQCPGPGSPKPTTTTEKVVVVESSAESSPQGPGEACSKSEACKEPEPRSSGESQPRPVETIDTATDKDSNETETLLERSADQVVMGEVMKNPETTSTVQDIEMEDDKARSEATFRYTVQNFCNLKYPVLSPACYVRNLPWRILVTTEQVPSSDGQQKKALGFFLQCIAESESASWSCYAMAELRLISHKPDCKTVIRKLQHLFYSKEYDWGYAQFMSWNNVLDPEKGYIKDDAITLEVYVTADAPQGVGYVDARPADNKLTIRSAIEKIRFLTLTSQQFAEGPARSSLLTESEAFAVIMNIASKSTDVAMPSGFSTRRDPRKRRQDIEMEDDKARSEATFRYTVQNFCNLKYPVLSPACYVRNLPWRILVTTEQVPSSDGQQKKALGFFLQCIAESESASWSCYAMAELRLISHKPDCKTVIRKLQHLFYSKEYDWGYAQFMSWNDVLDPEKGYIKDDAITLEVYVTADAPQGVGYVDARPADNKLTIRSAIEKIRFLTLM